MTEYEFQKQVYLILSDMEAGDMTPEEFEEEFDSLLEELNASKTITPCD